MVFIIWWIEIIIYSSFILRINNIIKMLPIENMADLKLLYYLIYKIISKKK